MLAVSLDTLTPVIAPLRAAYEASGLTQGQIAARAEVADHTVARVLTGRHVHTHSLIAVCAVLGLKVALVDAVAWQRQNEP